MQTKEQRIGDHTYRVTLLGALEGQALLVRLFKLVGPGGASFLEGLASGMSPDIEGAMAVGLGQAVRELASRLSVDEFKSISDKLASFTVVIFDDRQPRLSDCYDMHFAGRYDELLGWLAFALEVNFSSFFGGGAVRAGLGLILTKLGLVLKSRSTSTGTSTASQPVNATAPA